MSDEPDDLLRTLITKRVKAVLRTGLGLVGTLVAVTKFEALLELDTGGRLVVMKHAVELVEPLEEVEAWACQRGESEEKEQEEVTALRPTTPRTTPG